MKGLTLRLSRRGRDERAGVVSVGPGADDVGVLTQGVDGDARSRLLGGGQENGQQDGADDAIRAFRRLHRDLRLAPVVVVIPAFNEEPAIGRVLELVPREACALAVETLVVDDGSADRTSEVAAAHGAYVARLGRNLGQGSALRVGYALAREFGARYVVTLDADGQWDPAQIPSVLEPVVAGDADFVLGSRVLGRAETDDRFRKAGVHLFAALVRLLTGVRVTDTSSGLRALRTDVTAAVRQQETQYQASELLIGAICRGYRVTERPVVMHKRTAGKSKKGNNVLYGVRYARVILRTWWRERGARRNTSPGAPPRSA